MICNTIVVSECWIRAFQMSNHENRNCSVLLLTNGLGLDGAPEKFLYFVFFKPPNIYAQILSQTNRRREEQADFSSWIRSIFLSHLTGKEKYAARM